MADDPLAALRSRFHIQVQGHGWIIQCKQCLQRWSLQRNITGGVSTGSILHLLNHGIGHEEEQAGRGRDTDEAC